MLVIAQTVPDTIGQVWYEGSWKETAEVIKRDWIGEGILDCYGNTRFIKSPADLDKAVEEIGSCSDFGI